MVFIDPHYEVIYPYDARLDDELTTKPGDVIRASPERNHWLDGNLQWIEGKLEGNSGLFYRRFTKFNFKPLADCIILFKIKRIHKPGSVHRITLAESTYYTRRKPGKDLECIICKNLADDPHQTGCCGHTVCYNCADKWRKKSDSCPDCRVSPFLTVEDPHTKTLISSLTVYCPHYENYCNWEGSIAHVKCHLVETCICREITCPTEGCGMRMQRNDLDVHLKEECKLRKVSCPCRCSLRHKVTYKYIVEEHYKVCPNWPMRCPNNKYCNTTDLTRSTLQNHLENNCPEQVICCPFAEVGCTVKMKRKEMADHIQQSVGEHLSNFMADISMKNEHVESLNISSFPSSYDEIKNCHDKTVGIPTKGYHKLQGDQDEPKKDHDEPTKDRDEKDRDEPTKDCDEPKKDHDEPTKDRDEKDCDELKKDCDELKKDCDEPTKDHGII